MINVISTQDDAMRQGIDIHSIKQDDLVLLGVDRIDADNPDDVIRLFNETFRFLKIGEEVRIEYCPEKTEENRTKDRVSSARWRITFNLPRAVAKRRDAGQDVSQYLNFLHSLLDGTFQAPRNPPAPSQPRRTLGERFWDWLFDRIFWAIEKFERPMLGREALSELVFSMNYHEVFREDTWKVLLNAGPWVRNEGFNYLWILIGKIYTKYQNSELRTYLEGLAARSDHFGDERDRAATKVARVILKHKKLKFVEGPFGPGVALDE